jgi:hypothetical protein
MANFSSLQDLMQVAPTTGAFMSGQRFAGEQQASDLANQQTQQTLEHNAVMNPLNQQFRQGEIARQGADLQGVQYENQLRGNKVTLDNATLQQQIAANKSKLMTQMDEDSAKQMALFGQKVGQIGAALQQVPMLQRSAMLAQYAEKNNIPLDNPQLQVFLKAPPDKLPDLLMQTSKGMTQMGAEYIKTMDDQKLKNQGTERVAQINADAHRYSADKVAGAKAAGTDPELLFYKAKSARDKHAAALSLAERSRQIGDSASANNWAQMAEQLRPQAEAEIKSATPGSANTAALGIPTNQGPNIAPPGSQPQQQQHTLADVQKMYPGMTPAQLKQAYQNKFGVELK